MRSPDDETSVPATRDRRQAAVAAVLAAAYRAGSLEAPDALRILRHELRRLNTNTTLRIRPRSVAAQQVIDSYAEQGVPVPKNGSNDALHADHVHALTTADLDGLVSVEDWMAELPRLRSVVCVTAAENYRLEQLERAGHQGPEKYELAGIDWASESEHVDRPNSFS